MTDREEKTTMDKEMEKLNQEALDKVAGGAAEPHAGNQCPNCGHQGYKCDRIYQDPYRFYRKYTCPQCGHTFTVGAPPAADTGTIGWKDLDRAKREHGIAEIPDSPGK